MTKQMFRQGQRIKTKDGVKEIEMIKVNHSTGVTKIKFLKDNKHYTKKEVIDMRIRASKPVESKAKQKVDAIKADSVSKDNNSK